MRVCIFGASSPDIEKIYIEQTEALAEALASRGHSLMFGGGKNGLMGAAARGFKRRGGHVIGVAPDFFVRAGVIFPGCDEFVCPESMRDRKKYMEDNSAAFIVVPGGIGTFEEFFEVLTLKQLEIHSKPIVMFNIRGYFDSLLRFMNDNVSTGFVRQGTDRLFDISSDIEEVVRFIGNTE